MEKMTNRRGRCYALSPLEGINDQRVAYVAAILDEARERCIDLIIDMSDGAMWTRPEGSPFSAGDLVLHMNWAEYMWLPRIGQHRLSQESIDLIERGSLKYLYDIDDRTIPVGDLVALCRKTRQNLMIPCLKNAVDLDQEVGSAVPDGRGPNTVRQILMHVITSWVYHSGQVAFATMQNGLDYQWAFS